MRESELEKRVAVFFKGVASSNSTTVHHHYVFALVPCKRQLASYYAALGDVA